MNLQKTVPLSSIYEREEDFSTDLADNLDVLKVGEFADAETESKVGTRRADIVAVGEAGTLVVENQFGKADWHHWSRLGASARVKKATVAVLVAESFEDLMIVMCRRHNEDSSIDWYLIQAQANAHKELFFHHIVRPEIDIQTEKAGVEYSRPAIDIQTEKADHHIVRPAIDIQTEKAGVEYSEFWAPIRRAGLFAGNPVTIGNEGWIRKDIRTIGICLYCTKQLCYIQLYFNDCERRDRIMALFPESDYVYEYRNTPEEIKVKFPVLNKGRDNRDDWDEIREKLVEMGTDIYNKINESGL